MVGGKDVSRGYLTVLVEAMYMLVGACHSLYKYNNSLQALYHVQKNNVLYLCFSFASTLQP